MTEPTATSPETGFRPESLFAPPPLPELARMIEAILFASPRPLNSRELAERLPQGSDIPEALARLRAQYAGRGVELVRTGQGWAFRTAPDLGHLMHREVVENRKLSRAAVETLAIVAYHQPVTRTEVEEIRGVAVSKGTIDLLMEMGWIKLGRRRSTPGRPSTFVTTDGFLDHFGLESPEDLPGVAELRASGLLDARPVPGAAPSREEDDAAAAVQGEML
jgi:segregation and condensation protein B